MQTTIEGTVICAEPYNLYSLKQEPLNPAAESHLWQETRIRHHRQPPNAGRNTPIKPSLEEPLHFAVDTSLFLTQGTLHLLLQKPVSPSMQATTRAAPNLHAKTRTRKHVTGKNIIRGPSGRHPRARDRHGRATKHRREPF